MEILIWSLVLLLLFIGFVGSVVPLLPGTTLILVAVLLQKWLLPGAISWAGVAWIAAFWLLSVVADFACTLLGTRMFGGGKWGMAGASGGALVGMFFSLPVLLLGTMLGAVVAEKWGAKRSTGESLRSGAGATVGFLLGTVARFGCALAIMTVYGLAIYAALKPAVG
ncbi:MAG: DUF456 domain-containing protein [Lacunisphaera sp.]